MPDHVHMIFTPLNDEKGIPFGLAEILSGIKGASAHSINKALNRRGKVWQDESFDHLLRSDESATARFNIFARIQFAKGWLRKLTTIPGCGGNGLKAKGSAAASGGARDSRGGGPTLQAVKFFDRKILPRQVPELRLWRKLFIKTAS